MHLKSLITDDFPVVHPYEGVNAIEDILLKNKYVVVQDEKEHFYGILTPSDIIERPHKIVIDCLGITEKVYAQDSLESVHLKMSKIQKFVVPVFNNDSFLGIINIKDIVNILSTEKKSSEKNLEKATSGLQEEREKARMAEKLKDTFLQNISHEIRTPLNGLMGFADIISSSQFTDYKEKDFHNLFTKSSQRFLDTFNKIVEMARIQSGDIQYQKERTCSAKAIAEHIHHYFSTEQVIHDKYQLKLLVEKNAEDITFVSNYLKIIQILRHVTHNALKYTSIGFVEIGYKHEPEHVVFYVKDTGPGIPIDKKDKVFDAFEKIDVPESSHQSGVGLGLTIARCLVYSLKGDIWFDSIPNLGTTFYVRIPLKPI